jgi:hypothetical protein
VVEASAWGGAAVLLAVALWAMRDHVRDGGHILSAPIMGLVGVVGAAFFVVVLVFAALLLALALIGITLPQWFPLQFTF